MSQRMEEAKKPEMKTRKRKESAVRRYTALGLPARPVKPNQVSGGIFLSGHEGTKP